MRKQVSKIFLGKMSKSFVLNTSKGDARTKVVDFIKV